ncbi:Zinc finger and BTB domain-containing protein 49 [Araneus ventricosus]|uniref:Zinc finger and BTB domain-containing protein 49 n=1 Tax=Araneus ventricosus TaxID=182803 RepID=A0A4Y2J7H6_ARAVE|nr:Zinc finger and BTB domain-containing protein 49 [Araneus ventricosus]
MYRFLCQLCYTIVHYGEKHPCFYYKDYDTVYTIPQIDELEEMDTKHDETKEEHTGNSNDNYEDISAAALQNGNEESYETNALLTENTEQISLMPASRRTINYCSLFADTPNNTPYDISHESSLFDSIFSVREREVNSKENASFQALSESFEPDTISESDIRRTHKTKFSTTGYIRGLNKCVSNISSLCQAESGEKWEKLPDESNWRSFTHEKECSSESQEDFTLKLLSDSKNASEASTSFANSSFSIENRELDKKMFEVSEDLTDRPISPETAVIIPRRNGDEDATIKQHLVFMKDAGTMAEPSTIRPRSLRPVGKRPHACVSYPKQFKQNSDIVRHHRKRPGNNPFVCDICGKEFSAKGNFETHYRRHTGEKPFVCDICGKEFTTKGHLGTHYRRHTGEKSFVCDICNKGFFRKEDLGIHYRTHTGKKPFVCDNCGKEFTTKGNLGIHYRTHTGVKPYACNICGKSFSTGGNLKRHVPTHEGGKRFKCGVCGETFSSNDYRNRHHKEKHQ